MHATWSLQSFSRRLQAFALALLLVPTPALADDQTDAEALLRELEGLEASARFRTASRAEAFSLRLATASIADGRKGAEAVARRLRQAELALALVRRTQPDDALVTTLRLIDLRRVQRDEGRYGDAVSTFRQALPSLEQALGAEDLRVADLAFFVGNLLQSEGRQFADPWFARTVERHQRDGGSSVMLAAALAGLATGEVYEGDANAGLDLARQAAAVLDGGDEDVAIRATIDRLLAVAHVQLGAREAALAAAQLGVDRLSRRGPYESLFCQDAWRLPLTADIDVSRSDRCSESSLVSLQQSAGYTLLNVQLAFGDLDAARRSVASARREFLRSHQSATCRGSRCEDGLFISFFGGEIQLDIVEGDDAEATRGLNEYYRQTLRSSGAGHPALIDPLSNLGGAAARRGEFEDAIRFLRQVVSLSLAHDQNRPLRLGSHIMRLGQVYLLAGDPERASLMFRNPRSVFEHVDDLLLRSPSTPGVVAPRMHLMATLYAALGEYARAEDVLIEALAATREARGTEALAESEIRVQLMDLYVALGDVAAARAELTAVERIQAPFTREGSFKRWVVHNNRGFVASAEGAHENAIGAFDQALELLERFADDDSPDLRRVHVNRASARLRAGRPEAALEDYRWLMRRPYFETESLDRLDLLLGLARAELESGDTSAALEGASMAHTLAWQFDLPTRRWRADALLADVLAAEGAEALAIAYGKRAVNGLQAIRDRLEDGRFEATLNTVTDRRSVYRNLAGRLAEAGRISEASLVLKMLRERELREMTVRAAAASETRLELADEETQLLAAADLDGASLQQIGVRLRELVHASAGTTSSREAEREIARLREQARRARQAFAGHVRGLVRGLVREIAQQPERSMELVRRELPSLGALQGAIARTSVDEVILHYIVLPDRLHVLLTAADVQLARVVDVDEATLAQLVAEHRADMIGVADEHQEAGRLLHDLLIEPLRADLDALAPEVLVVAPDGVLRYVSFAALWDGEQYLVERHALARFTAASRYLVEAADDERQRALAFGVTRSLGDQPPLPAVRGEVEALIRTEGGDDGVYDGVALLDEAFTAARLSEELRTAEQRLDVVHLASHFSFVPGSERDSRLLLGDGGMLSLEDLRYGDFPLTGVDLLTLSACETAIDGDGAEFEGLASIAQERGAEAVLATLWPVADRSTAHFMKSFYETAERQRHGHARSIAAVQRRILAGQEEGMEQLTHPFYWAPFVLSGSWL